MDKRRFEVLEREKKARLKKLSFKEGIEMEENLLSSGFLRLMRKSFLPDNPVCLKYALRNR